MTTKLRAASFQDGAVTNAKIAADAIHSVNIAAGAVDSDAIGSSAIPVNKLNIGQIGGRRNMIINGAIQVAQRASTVTGIGGSSGYFTADRWRINVNGTSAGRLTMKHAAPNDLPGFQRAIKLECTTADTSIAAGERMFLEQKLEGQDVQGMMKGTSDAKPVTVSFYVKGHDSATYTVGLYEATTGRKIAATFPVTTSWARQTVTFPGDTTGVIPNDNTAQLHLRFYLHAGSNYTSGTLGTSWNADGNTTQISSSGNSFFESTSAEFFLTGVQMEIGSQATPFEYRSLGDEQNLCWRYYYKTNQANHMLKTTSAGASGDYYWYYYLPIPMRASPTCTVDGGSDNYNHTASPSIMARGSLNMANINYSKTGTNSQAYFTMDGITADAEL